MSYAFYNRAVAKLKQEKNYNNFSNSLNEMVCKLGFDYMGLAIADDRLLTPSELHPASIYRTPGELLNIVSAEGLNYHNPCMKYSASGFMGQFFQQDVFNETRTSAVNDCRSYDH